MEDAVFYVGLVFVFIVSQIVKFIATRSKSSAFWWQRKSVNADIRLSIRETYIPGDNS